MKKLPLLLALLAALPATAQTDSLQTESTHRFRVGAQAWTRGEWRNGGLSNKEEQDNALFIMESTLLWLEYQQKGFEVRIAPKHFGVWGAQGGGAFSLDEGWMALRHPSGLFLKLGRQKLAYDDERIIGNNDWAMAGSRHDVLKAGYDGTRHKAHLIFAFNQNNENTSGGTYYVNGGQPYKSMQTLWYHFDPIPKLGLSLLFMNTGMQSRKTTDNVTEYQQLYGAYTDASFGIFNFKASWYRQSGHDDYARSIRAWMASSELTGTLTPHLRMNTGYFYMSGDPLFYVPDEGMIGLSLKKEVRGFNPIFGSHHKFYGAMDFFYVTTYYGGNTPGLQDFHIGATVNPVKQLSINTSYHYLATSVKVEDASRTLGHELEFSASWDIMQYVTLMAGYSYMHGTETMAILKRTHGKNQLNWGWLMLVVTPEFFSYSW